VTSRRIYLVRHGETVGESSIRYHGRNDVPLSDSGREQIRRLVPLLAGREFAAVLHSPLSRAAESAEMLVAGLELPPALVEAVPGFTEIDFGDNEGLTAEEIESARPDWYRAWRNGQVNGFPGGDTFAGFAARVAAAWDDVLARHPSGDLLVVAHRGTIKRAVLRALGSTDESRGNADLGSLTVLRSGSAPELLVFNQVPEPR